MSAHPSSTPEHRELVTQLIGRWPESHPQPSLERIKALCGLLGEPQDACPVIQITGTNGKGSTAIMIDALLRAQGLRVGRFSSPHLVDVTERICIDGEPISHDAFDETWRQIAPMVAMVDEKRIDGVPMTFFEVMTGMAYAAFADAPVDVAVMEVGMGGRWDATSVAHPAVSVVLPIDLDHTHLLGSTIAEIAEEKSGIIKQGSVAVLAGQQPEAAGVLMNRCAQQGVPVLREGLDFSLTGRARGVGGQVLSIESSGRTAADLFLPLIGEHMASNAAVAVAAVEAMQGGRPLSAEVINAAFDAVVAPARLETVNADPLVILDTAHNPHGMRASLAGLAEAVMATPLIAVIAMMKDKDVAGVLGLVGQVADEIIVTTMPGNERALSVAAIEKIASDVCPAGTVETAKTPDEALDCAMESAIAHGPDAAVFVAGSVYLAGEVRHRLVGEGPAPRLHPDVVVD